MKIISVFCLKMRAQQAAARIKELNFQRNMYALVTQAPVILDFDKWSVFKLVYSTLKLKVQKVIGAPIVHCLFISFFLCCNFIFILDGMCSYVRFAMHRHTAIL